MAGSREGSKKAVATILAKNPNFFKEIGRIGGRAITDKKKRIRRRPRACTIGRFDWREQEFKEGY